MPVCLLFFLSISLSPASDAEPTGRISGVVRTRVSQRPLAGVRITVIAAPEGSAASGETRIQTSENGRFTLDHLTAGRYALAFAGTEVGATPIVRVINLSEKERMDSLVVELPDAANVSGRLTFPDGTPVSSGRVLLFVRRIVRGMPQFELAKTVTASDDGVYKLNDVRAEQAYLIVAQRKGEFSFPPPQPDSSGRRMGFLSTFYGQTADPRSAIPIYLKPADNIATADIRLQVGEVFCVSGTVKTDFHDTTYVSLYNRGGAVRWQLMGRVLKEKNKEFQFCNLPRGEYQVRATIGGDRVDSSPWLASRTVVVANGDYQDLELEPMPSISFTFRSVDAPPVAEPAVPPSSQRKELKSFLRIRPLFRGPMVGESSGAICPVHGDCVVPHLFPNEPYMVQVDPPPGRIVKALALKSTDLREEALIMEPSLGDTHATIELTSDVRSLSVRVQNANGDPVSGITVTAFPSSVSTPKGVLPNLSIARTDAKGNCSLLVGKGKYYLGAENRTFDFTEEAAQRLLSNIGEAKLVDTAPAMIGTMILVLR